MSYQLKIIATAYIQASPGLQVRTFRYTPSANRPVTGPKMSHGASLRKAVIDRSGLGIGPNSRPSTGIERKRRAERSGRFASGGTPQQARIQSFWKFIMQSGLESECRSNRPGGQLADGVRFELTGPLQARRFSRPLP